MPAVKTELPEKLRPFNFHKVNLTSHGETTEATGECPFCLGNKWYCSPTSGLYDCKNPSCLDPDGKSGGNIYTFIRHLHAVSSATDAELEEVAHERKLTVEVLKRWGMVKSAIDGRWMLPGYGFNSEGKLKLNNLYRWTPMKQNDGTYKNRMLTTTDLKHCLGGVQFWDASKKAAYINEGYFDGMAWESALMKVKISGGKIVYTNEPSQSLYANANVVAVPGADTFKEDWPKLFKGIDVVLMYDSDHPKERKGKILPPGGWTGMKSAAKKLHGIAASISVVTWSSLGYNPDLPSGFDIRDALTSEALL
mgnify:CR=1 FL=1